VQCKASAKGPRSAACAAYSAASRGWVDRHARADRVAHLNSAYSLLCWHSVPSSFPLRLSYRPVSSQSAKNPEHGTRDNVKDDAFQSVGSPPITHPDPRFQIATCHATEVLGCRLPDRGDARTFHGDHAQRRAAFSARSRTAPKRTSERRVDRGGLDRCATSARHLWCTSPRVAPPARAPYALATSPAADPLSDNERAWVGFRSASPWRTTT